MASGHADRGERVVDQQRAAVGDAPAPVADVGAGRTEAVGAVDVEDVDRAFDGAVGGVGEGRHVADPIGRRRLAAGWPRRRHDRRPPRRRSRRSPAGPCRCRRAGRWPRPRPCRRRRRRGRSSTGPGSCRSRRSGRPPGPAPRRRTGGHPGRRVIHPSTPAASASTACTSALPCLWSSPRSLIAGTRPCRRRPPRPRRAVAAHGRWRRPPPARRRGPARARGRSAAGP